MDNLRREPVLRAWAPHQHEHQDHELDTTPRVLYSAFKTFTFYSRLLRLPLTRVPSTSSLLPLISFSLPYLALHPTATSTATTSPHPHIQIRHAQLPHCITPHSTESSTLHATLEVGYSRGMCLCSQGSTSNILMPRNISPGTRRISKIQKNCWTGLKRRNGN